MCFIKQMSSYNEIQLISYYTLNQVFCRIQSIVYLQFYLYSIGKIVNKQRFVCDRIPGSRHSSHVEDGNCMKYNMHVSDFSKSCKENGIHSINRLLLNTNEVNQ